MSDAPEYRTQRRRWFVELGYCDGNGMGTWEHTKESHEVVSQDEARALERKWLADGALIVMRWGELRPTYPYGVFRIRSEWVDDTDPALAERDARIAALEAGLRDTLDRYTTLANSGDAGFWDCNEEPHVIAARALLDVGKP